MGQQLERLASQDEDTLASKDPDLADKPKLDAADASTGGDGGQHEAELEDLDKEIAELDKQLVAARAELQGLLQDKVALEGEVALTGQQLEALAVQEASNS
jgi:predicted  nucleic acid-binding Zn-ribbon protein